MRTSAVSLGCIQRSVASRTRKGILPLLCSGETSPTVLHPALGSQHRKDMELLEQVQRRDTKVIKGMGHLSYEERLKELGLFSLEKRFWGDLIAAFQYLKGDIKKDGEMFPRACSDRSRGNGLKLIIVLDEILGWHSLIWGWWGNGTGCPEQLWMPHS